jgi:hypothetical protein
LSSIAVKNKRREKDGDGWFTKVLTSTMDISFNDFFNHFLMAKVKSVKWRGTRPSLRFCLKRWEKEKKRGWKRKLKPI